MSVVSLSKVCKRFGEKIIFDNYDLDVEEGEFVSITGESGKGKTTLLNIMGFLEKPDSGDVTLLGVKNANFDSKAARELRRNKLSYLFQNYGLIENETVERNLLLAMEFKDLKLADKKERISMVLEKLGIPNIEKRKIYTLSGGEQQRIGLGKIILKEPSLILADEPTGSLDPGNRDFCMEILRDINTEGKTVIVVTHDPAFDSYATRKIDI